RNLTRAVARPETGWLSAPARAGADAGGPWILAPSRSASRRRIVCMWETDGAIHVPSQQTTHIFYQWAHPIADSPHAAYLLRHRLPALTMREQLESARSVGRNRALARIAPTHYDAILQVWIGGRLPWPIFSSATPSRTVTRWCCSPPIWRA